MDKIRHYTPRFDYTLYLRVYFITLQILFFQKIAFEKNLDS